jgi:DNA-binding beta-propeller fold protein YncE
VAADEERVFLQVFDNAGRFVRSIGSEGDGSGQFRYLWGVAVGGGGEIIVSDFGRRDVQVFSRQGSLLQTIGSEGDSRVDLTMPRCELFPFLISLSSLFFSISLSSILE